MILIANICVHFQLLFGGWLITSAEKQNIQIESLKLGRDRGLVIPAVFELSVLLLSKSEVMSARNALLRFVKEMLRYTGCLIDTLENAYCG